MKEYMIDDVRVLSNIDDGNELAEYVKAGRNTYGKALFEMTCVADGEYVGIDYKFAPIRFDRIRRITGYLVGTLDRFNNGKRAEESDRVKHNVGGGDND